jgi:secondary thiamine-phosphate synthase enzyme
MRTFPLANEVVQTRTRTEIVDLTDRVQRIVSRCGVIEGFLIVYCPHTTAGITINENADPDVKQDLLAKLEKLVPQMETYYQQDEGNSDAHVKTALVGNSATVLIEHGRLFLGRWQGIYFCEFDGPRERRVVVKLVDLAKPGE